MKKITLLLSLTVCSFFLSAQHSVARDWNEELLEAIRKDFARPTVHARNLFHSAVVMYDSWAVFDSQANTIFLGKNFQNYTCQFNGIVTPIDLDAARHEMMSYAIYRLLTHRFANSPGSSTSLPAFEALFNSYGYDESFSSVDYSTGSYAALGNYLASEIILFGNQDESNEIGGYGNQFYQPVNDPIILDLYEDNSAIDPNHWQPLAFDFFIDQSGNPFPQATPQFLSPEWGEVKPFCLRTEDLQILNNDFDCFVYNDPGPPVYIQDSNNEDGLEDPYKWHFALVASWSAQLDPNPVNPLDDPMIDISPRGIGNVDIADYPETFEEYQAFYNFTDGGDIGTGRLLNPITGQEYVSQMVKRSDYARVLAEFWADGPDSETPPGHWFTILNYVSDHPETVKKFGGQGSIISDLEWDVKSYIALGGAMHDSAINTWGIKGYYDYVRPISAIRYMASKGQSTDNTSTEGIASYDPHGIPLIQDYIEIITENDPLYTEDANNLHKIKIKAWKGPDYITDPETDVAGVDWILGTHWWPYQRGTFVTPPFAGYLSGHSTFSRAAAEVMTLITGSEFFPGGMGTFDITANDFLVFEDGPSASFTLQWATYRDASDQTSLSRIWGGIHPPIDDIKGRIIGEKIGVESFNLALQYFSGTLSNNDVALLSNEPRLFPSPFQNEFNITVKNQDAEVVKIFTIDGKLIMKTKLIANDINTIQTAHLTTGVYFAQILRNDASVIITKKIMKK